MTLGGQDKNNKIDNKSTGLTGPNVGLTGNPTGLTGSRTSLTSASNELESSSKSKAMPSFKELLAKYEKKCTTQKMKKQPDGAKYTKSSSKHQEQSVSCPLQGNYVVAHYGLIAPLFILTFIRPSIIVGCICNHVHTISSYVSKSFFTTKTDCC